MEFDMRGYLATSTFGIYMASSSACQRASFADRRCGKGYC
jgi:hypothetical protein